jgi:hypothetical protein
MRFQPGRRRGEGGREGLSRGSAGRPPAPIERRAASAGAGEVEGAVVVVER